MSGLLIAKNPSEHWVLSSNGSLIYIAGNNGILKVHDAGTGELISTKRVGTDLGTIALSPDGSKLVITEDVARNVQQSNDWTTNSADVDIYVVDTASFVVSRKTFPSTGSQFTFADVAFVDSDTVHLSQNILPGWSGWEPLFSFDLTTNQFSSSGSFYSGLGSAPSLTSVPDSDDVLLGQLGLSSAQYYMIDAGRNAAHDNGVYENGVYGYASGVEAVSGTGPDGRIAIFTAGNLHLYNGEFDYLAKLTNLAPDLNQAAGLTFSNNGAQLFVLDDVNDRVVVIDHATLSVRATMDLPGFVAAQMKLGDEIVLSSDGRKFFFNAIDGIHSADVVNTITGTEGADTLQGTDGLDILLGMGGNDLIIGSPGVDAADGGEGFDTLRMWMDANDYFPPFVGEESYVLTSDRFSDAAGRVDTSFSNIELFSFLAGDGEAISFDGSAYQPGESAGFYATNLFIYGSGSNVVATNSNDFIGTGGTDLVFDGGGGYDKLSVNGGNGVEGTIYITASGSTLSFFQQDIFGPALAITATNFESATVSSNYVIDISRTVDAFLSPVNVDFYDGVSADTFLGSAFADNFISAITPLYTNRDGIDTYTGNGGADFYSFGRDLFRLGNTIITDFDADDVIDLDAPLSAALKLTVFIGTQDFSGFAGEYRYEKVRGKTLVQYDGNGDRIADGTLTLANGEFDLSTFVDLGGNPHNLRLGKTIVGTPANNRIVGTNGIDFINGLGGNDTIYGRQGDDVIDGGDGDDFLYGDLGDNLLIGGLGLDRLFGGAGSNDMRGGAGNDTYFVYDEDDIVTELPSEGVDFVRSGIDYTLGSDVEDLQLAGAATVGTGNALANRLFGGREGATLSGLDGDDTIYGSEKADSIYGGNGIDRVFGNYGIDLIYGGEDGDILNGGGNGDTLYGDGGNDLLRGDAGHDTLFGGDGDDKLEGGLNNDTLRGEAGLDRMFGDDGVDILIGGADRDILTGGLGADDFVFGEGDFAGLTASTADRIVDFTVAEGDDIDLSAIDAMTGGEDDAFDYLGNSAFSGRAGEVRWAHEGANTMVYMDVDGDALADYAIRLDGTINLAEASFIL